MIYIFECSKCNVQEEREIPISDYDKEKNNQVCNTCKSKMNRVFIPIGNTIYSCGGFYDTDTRGVKCR